MAESLRRARSISAATISTRAPWLSVPVKVSRSIASTRAFVWREIRPCADRNTRYSTIAAMSPADTRDEGHVHPDRIRGRQGSARRRARRPTTARTWPSVTSGKYSRTTCSAASGSPTDSLTATSAIPAVAVAPVSAVVKSVEGRRNDPARGGLVGGEDPAVRQANLDAEDLAGFDEVRQPLVKHRLALGCQACRSEVVGRQAAGHEQADEPRIGTDRRVEGGRRKIRRDQRRLGDRGQADDHEEDPVDEDQQDWTGDSTRGPEHGGPASSDALKGRWADRRSGRVYGAIHRKSQATP